MQNLTFECIIFCSVKCHGVKNCIKVKCNRQTVDKVMQVNRCEQFLNGKEMLRYTDSSLADLPRQLS